MRIKHTVRMIAEALENDKDGKLSEHLINQVGHHFGRQLVRQIHPQVTPYRDGAPFDVGYEFSLELEVMSVSEFEKVMDDHRKVSHRMGFEEGKRAAKAELEELIMKNLFNRIIAADFGDGTASTLPGD